MKIPSALSIRLIPAANSTGSVSTAYHGRPATAPVPASASSATSVAVSNPRPKIAPTANICRGRLIRAMIGRRRRASTPRLSSRSSSSPSSKRPARSAVKTRQIPIRATTLTNAMRKRNPLEASVPTIPRTWRAGEASSSSAPAAFAAEITSSANTTTIAACPSAKKNPTDFGRALSAVSFRVTLSIAAIWSASNACRRPSM